MVSTAIKYREQGEAFNTLPSTYIGQLVGLQPALEVDARAHYFPVRALIILHTEIILGRKMEVFNAQSQSTRGRNQFWLEHIFYCPEGTVQLDDQVFPNNEAVRQYIGYQQHCRRPYAMTQATLTSRAPGALEFESIQVQLKDELVLQTKDLYQRTRREDGQPFMNDAGEYMWHTRYLYIEGLA